MSIILVVDDSHVDRKLVGGMLSNIENYTIEFASNGIEALRVIQKSAPDLLLTDLFMPEMDGLHLVESIRQQIPALPIILMTSQGNEETAAEALQRGASSYVPKRLLSRYLHSTVERLLLAAKEQYSREKLLGSMQRSQCVFSLSSDLDLIPSLVGYFQESMSHMGLCDESERLRVSVALEEALTNAVHHGNLEVSSKLREKNDNAYYQLINERRKQSPYRDRHVRVQVSMSDGAAKFVVMDEGPGFDVSQLPDPTNPENLEKASGRGVMLMRTFMDEVVYNDAGNEVTLVKRTKSSGIGKFSPRVFSMQPRDDRLLVSVLKNVTSLADEQLAEELELILDYIRQNDVGRVVIDMENVTRFGSSFLESLRRIWSQLHAREGKLVMCNVSPLGEEVLRISRFDELFEVVPSRDEALRLN